MTTTMTIVSGPLSLFSGRRLSVAGKVPEEVAPPIVVVALAVTGGGCAVLLWVIFYFI